MLSLRLCFIAAASCVVVDAYTGARASACNYPERHGNAVEEILTSLLLINAELLPVLSLELFQLTENTVLLLLGESLPAGLNVGDDVAELDLVGALNVGASVAGSLKSPSLLLGDHGAAAEESGGAETASGSASNVLADHCDVLTRMAKEV